jgi:hypothetical protein
MFLFVIRSKVPCLLNAFALNTTFLTPKYKSSTGTTNQTSYTRTTTIVQKKKKLLKWIWQQTNKVAKKWDLLNTHLQKHTLEKTQACKKHQYKMKV